jgi:hypothetical protein
MNGLASMLPDMADEDNNDESEGQFLEAASA